MASKIVAGFNDLATTHPAIAKELHPVLNPNLSALAVSAGSDKKVWWLCPLGHPYSAPVSTRTRNTPAGCGVCAGRQILRGVNDFESVYPSKSLDWHPTLNGRLRADEVSPASNKVAWWRCRNGHEFQARIEYYAKHQCSFCTNHSVWRGFNDLESQRPDLIEEWDFAQNSLAPSELTYRSRKKVAWKCAQGHRWVAEVYSRSTRSTGCSACKKLKVVPGENDAATLNPGLVDLWAEDLNGPCILNTLSAFSKRVFSWRCGAGHVVSASVGSKNLHPGCGKCAGNTLNPGVNDLATLYPELATQWDYALNGNIPSEVAGNSHYKAWWRCAAGHSWPAAIGSRSRGVGCPDCRGTNLVVGTNDLETIMPELVPEWSEDNEAKPSETHWASHKKAIWVCDEGHTWTAVIKNRSRGKTGCPKCSTGGFMAGKPSYLYLIKNQELNSRKIGISNQDAVPNRLEMWKSFDWDLIARWDHADGQFVRENEGRILLWLRTELGLAPAITKAQMNAKSGWSETFDMSSPTDEEVCMKISSLFGIA